MIGIADSNRLNEYTAKISAAESSASDTPMFRSDSTSTKYSATWLSTVVHVSMNHRRLARMIVSRRNVAPCRPCRPAWACGAVAGTALNTRPTNRPTALAIASLRNTSTSSVTAIASTTRPIPAAAARAGFECPVITRSPSATIGSPSLTKMFQIPVTPMNSVISPAVKPHVLSIAAVTPTPNAPPAGSVLATVVLVCVTTADCPRPIPISPASLASQYV